MMWFGWGSVWMTLSMIVFWGAVVLLVLWGLHALDPQTRDQASSRRILDERFARSEIDQEDYERMTATLRGR